jgi:hypothetical protein
MPFASGVSSMNSKQHREFARICIDLANSTSADKEMQRALFDMAKAWFAIANETEAREQLHPGFAGDPRGERSNTQR